MRYHCIQVFLIGTAHVSRKSAADVRALMQQVKPTHVFLELDAERAAKLRADASNDPLASNLINSLLNSKNSASFGASVVEMFLRLLYNAMRAAGLVQGGEFVAAIEESEKIGAEIVYFDRHYRTTLSRIAQEAPKDVMSVLKLMLDPKERAKAESELNLKEFVGLEERVNSLLFRDRVRKLVSSVRSTAPHVTTALLDERDLIMTNALKSANHERIVAVVGMAHMDGIENLWQQPQAVVERKLRAIPA